MQSVQSPPVAAPSTPPTADREPGIDGKFSVERRKAMYFELTQLSDEGNDSDVEKRVAIFRHKHHLTKLQVGEINAEGISNQWPVPK